MYVCLRICLLSPLVDSLKHTKRYNANRLPLETMSSLSPTRESRLRDEEGPQTALESTEARAHT